MKNFFQQRSLYPKFLLSYFIILIIPILAMIFFVNYQFMGVLQKDLISENSNTLQRVMYVVDSYIKQIESVKTHIQINRNLYPQDASNESELARDIQRELSKYLVSNSFIKEIVIHYRNDRLLYSSTNAYTVPFFINHAYRYSTWKEEDFNKDINSIKVPTTRPAEDTEFNNQTLRLVTFIYPVASTGVEPTTTILFLVDEKFFAEIMETSFESHQTCIMIFDGQDRLITASEILEAFPMDDLKGHLNGSVDPYSKTITLQNQKLLLSVQKSSETDWKYVSLTPIRELSKKTAGIQAGFILITFVILLVGSILIYYYMQTNYKPLQNLKNYADKLLHQNNKPSNEIELVKNTIDYLSNQNKKLKSTFIVENNAADDQSFVSQIISYIQSNFTDSNFSIQNMADHFGVTLTNLSQYFKNQTGQTILDYTTGLKMEKARNLLTSTDLSLNQIASEVGYQNVSSFIRRFKQFTGLTPGSIRRKTKTGAVSK